MRLWNVGEKPIRQMYNSKLVTIEANQVIELADDLAVFLLGKREIRAQGLVQVKSGDSRKERYYQGKLQIYQWATQKYEDYEKHCEEREESKRHPLKPHQAILDYKKIIEEYDKWDQEGKPVGKDLMVEIDGRKVVYPCPDCDREFEDKTEYFKHLESHKEKVNVDTGPVSNAGEGEG